MLPVLDPGQNILLGSAVAGQLVGDHDTRRTHLLLQQLAQQAFSGGLVAPALDENIEHEPVLVHRPPEPALHPSDLHCNLIEVPFIAGSRQPAADLVGECLAKFQAPLPYGLMADDDAAGGEDLIDMAQAERKAEIQPDGVADDLGWEAVADIAGWGGRCHRIPLRDPGLPRQARRPGYLIAFAADQVDGARHVAKQGGLSEPMFDPSKYACDTPTASASPCCGMSASLSIGCSWICWAAQGLDYALA